MTPIQLQTAIDNLDQMIASGVLTAEYDGRRITYSSIADLIKAREHLSRQLTAAPPGEPVAAEHSRVTYAAFGND